MKILVLASRVPSLNAKGDQAVAFRRIRALLQRHYVVHLVCLYNIRSAEDAEGIKYLRKLGVIVYPSTQSRVLVVWNLTKACFSATPFQVALFSDCRVRKQIEKIIETQDISVVVCVMLRLGDNLPKGGSVPMVVDLVDSMALNFERKASKLRWLNPLGILYRIEAKRLLKYERLLAKLCDVTITVSAIDRDYINAPNVMVIPLGVDLSFTADRPEQFAHEVIFTGNMSYSPNIEAICWFYENCWADIRREVVDAKLIIVGDRPSHLIYEVVADDSSVVVTGRVDSVLAMIANASVAVAPMRSGSGMQFKILEAMLMKVPVIASQLGIGDIRASVGVDIIKADAASEFVFQTVALLLDEEYNVDVGLSGYKYIAKNHSLERQQDEFLGIVKKLGERKGVR